MLTKLMLVGALAATLVGRASVIDGDTIDIHGTRIRIWGIDAPESAQLCKAADGSQWRCGQQSALALQKLLGEGAVNCQPVDRDRYGRSVSKCRAGSTDVGGWMVSNGWAVDFKRYSGNAYASEERTAHSAKKNIWSSEFEMPWDWRADKRGDQQHFAGAAPVRVAPAPAPSGRCLIKGNINSKGDHIFHSPGQADYDKTVITEGKGERWFCSSKEANAAGWRAAVR